MKLARAFGAVAAAVVLSAVWPSAARGAGRPFVSTGIGPKEVTVGQPVALTVTVFVPTWFTGAPSFPQLEVKDAVVVFLEQGGANTNTTVGDQTYAGQSRQYLVYPQRAGEFTVPPFSVDVRYAIDAKPSPLTPVQSQGARFTAVIPEAAQGLEHFVATTSLRVESAVTPPPTGLKVGDSLTRTVTVTADNVFSMMLPPLTFPAVEGLSVYPASPRLSDTGGERGTRRVATRVESVTYQLQKEGSYELPEIDVAWWDTGARAIRRSKAPAVSFTVAANPHLKPEIALPDEPTVAAGSPPFDWRAAVRRYGPLALIALLALVGLNRLLKPRTARLAAGLRARRRAREESEAAYLKRLVETARSGTAAEVLNATYRWLDRRSHPEPAARLDRFAERSAEQDLPPLADALVDAAIGARQRTGPADAVAYVAALERAARSQAERAANGVGLGPLNPRS